MAMSNMFAKMALTGDGDSDDEDEEATSPQARSVPTLSLRSITSFDAPGGSRGARLTGPQAAAFAEALRSSSLEALPGQSLGACHFRLAKKGTGTVLDVVLGDPCICTDQRLPGADKRVSASTALVALYFVLLRVLLAKADDPAMARAPRLDPPTIERLLGSMHAARQRARARGTEGAAKRAAYERDPVVAPGEVALDFAACLGTGEPAAASHGSPTHPRAKHFGSMPSVVLGAGNNIAADSLRGRTMDSVDTEAQVERLWTSALQRRPQRTASEPFGQTGALRRRQVAMGRDRAPDPHWGFAQAHAGPATFPWRRELAPAEQVALLTKGGGGGAGGGPKRRPRGGGGGGGGGWGDVTTRVGLDAWGLPAARLAAADDPLAGGGGGGQRPLPPYPCAALEGRVAVDAGVVLPAGMGIRHPALARAARFKRAIVEFLELWSLSGDPAERHALGAKVDALWRRHAHFRAWARATYGKNRRRRAHLEANPIRISVLLPDARCVGLRIGALSTGLALKVALEAKVSGLRCGGGGGASGVRLGSKESRTALLFEGVPVDDRVSLRDAGVRARSTLVLTRIPSHMHRGDGGLPVY